MHKIQLESPKISTGPRQRKLVKYCTQRTKTEKSGKSVGTKMAEPSNCNKNKIYKCLNRRVILNGKFSTRADVLRGAPQGSVLGTLLFVIFIYDIEDAMIQDFKNSQTTQKLVRQ